MPPLRLIPSLLVVVCLAAQLSAQQLASVDQFKSHIAQSQAYTDEQKRAALGRLDALTADGAGSTEIIAETLELLDEDFAACLAGYRSGEFDQTIAKLETLKSSTDPFVATEARYYLANCHVARDDHEAALPLLQADQFASSPRASDALFLSGVCQASMLRNAEAKETLAAFLRTYPNASQRQRHAALALFEKLSALEPGSLVDIYQKMEFSRRRLALAKANEPTQSRQKEVLAILDKLIKEAEEREAMVESESKQESEGKKDQTPTEGHGAGKEGSGKGTDGKSPAQTVRQVQQEAEKSPWDFLRDKKRDAEALAAIKEKYPARYRALIEQYYRSLQDESER